MRIPIPVWVIGTISSHKADLAGEANGWTTVEEVLPLWGKSRAQAIAAYRRFMREGIKDGHRDDLYEVVDQRYLGSDAFVEKVAQRKPDGEVAPMVEIDWAEIKERVGKHYGLPPSVVFRRGRGRVNARIKRVMAWVGQEVGGLTNQEMAIELAQDSAALRRGLGDWPMSWRGTQSCAA